jgi:hypothetical protein
MNTVRKIALVAMVVRGEGQGGSGKVDCSNDAIAQLNACIAIVDLALEKVLKRQTEENATTV